MNVRRRRTQFRPVLDRLPSRIAPTIYTPIDVMPMGSGESITSQSTATPTSQIMPTDASDMVGPSY